MREMDIKISRSKKNLYFYVIISGGMIVWFFVGPYVYSTPVPNASRPFVIIFELIFFGVLIHSIVELIRRTPEMTISNDGIEFRNYGFYHWDIIKSFKGIYKTYDKYDKDFLLFRFKGLGELEFNVSHLEKKKVEIVQLILENKKNAAIIYEE